MLSGFVPCTGISIQRNKQNAHVWLLSMFKANFLKNYLLDISHQGVTFLKRHSEMNYLFSFPSAGNPSLRFRKGI